VQVTTKGGFAAFESRDGKTVYYANSREANPEIWQVPVEGGLERKVSPAIQPGTWASWAPTARGLYFVEEGVEGAPSLSFYDFATQETKKVAALEKFPFWLAISKDGTKAAFQQSEQPQSNIMVQENFH
jgi:Tol biopolymer transport system component